MTLEISDSCPSVGKRRIQQFERESGITLPADYRDFLLKHNGGHPVKCRFTIPALREEALLEYLFAIDGPAGANLEDQLSEWADEMPEGFLPIGRDRGGAIIIMGTMGEYADQIFYWDHQHRFVQSSAEANTYPVGKSFATFLAGLKRPEPSKKRKKRPTKFSELLETLLKRKDGIMPIEIARLSVAFSELPRRREVVTKLMSALFDHDSSDLRRIAIHACRRAKVFDVPGLQKALIEKLSDEDPWIRYDAAWTIGEAGYDGTEVRKALTKLAGKTKLPRDEIARDKNPSNAELSARVQARKALDALLGKS
jgi:hypothetical protein